MPQSCGGGGRFDRSGSRSAANEALSERTLGQPVVEDVRSGDTHRVTLPQAARCDRPVFGSALLPLHLAGRRMEVFAACGLDPRGALPTRDVSPSDFKLLLS